MSLIPDDQFRAFSQAAPDRVMDDPTVSSFWRRRAALTMSMADPNAPWVDIIGAMEHREYRRDVTFAGELALRHLRVENERLEQAVIELATALDNLGARIYRDLHVEASDSEVTATVLADFSTYAEECLTALDNPAVKQARWRLGR